MINKNCREPQTFGEVVKNVELLKNKKITVLKFIEKHKNIPPNVVGLAEKWINNKQNMEK